MNGDADSNDILAFIRDAGFELVPWQERLCRMVFAEPHRPLSPGPPLRWTVTGEHRQDQ